MTPIVSQVEWAEAQKPNSGLEYYLCCATSGYNNCSLFLFAP